jgi:hypothetical protein
MLWSGCWTDLLLNLKLIYNRRKLGENLICLLVEFQLSGNQLSKVAERLRRIEDLVPISKMPAITAEIDFIRYS